MLIAFLTHLRAVDPRSSSDAATDSLLDGYVAWREACADVSTAYERWTRSVPCDRSLAFATYQAALDREEQASLVYERRVERVRRWAVEAGCASTGRAVA
jgi:hypothetical protein